MDSSEISFELIERITPGVRARVLETPLLPSPWLSELAGAEVLLKCENLQLTHSFKIRGAIAKFVDTPGLTGVASASAGNHGQGLAWAAREFGAACKIFVPRSIPRVKEDAIRALGAELVKSPFDGFDETDLWAREKTGGASWVSAFDDPHVMAGNGGTVVLEILERAPRVDCVVVSCGGGGMAIGAGVALHCLRPGSRVVGVNSESSPGMWLSRRDGRAHPKIESKATIAEGIEGGVPQSTYELGLRHIDDVVVVTEASIRRAVVEALRRHALLIEGSAAAAVAALMEGKIAPGVKSIAVVLSGGNIDPARLESLLAEFRDLP